MSWIGSVVVVAVVFFFIVVVVSPSLEASSIFTRQNYPIGNSLWLRQKPKSKSMQRVKSLVEIVVKIERFFEPHSPIYHRAQVPDLSSY